MTDEQFGADLVVLVGAYVLWGWLGWAAAEHPTAAIVSALAGVLVALIGAWVEAARQSLRERMAKLEGRVEALEKSK